MRKSTIVCVCALRNFRLYKQVYLHKLNVIEMMKSVIWLWLMVRALRFSHEYYIYGAIYVCYIHMRQTYACLCVPEHCIMASVVYLLFISLLCDFLFAFMQHFYQRSLIHSTATKTTTTITTSTFDMLSAWWQTASASLREFRVCECAYMHLCVRLYDHKTPYSEQHNCDALI